MAKEYKRRQTVEGSIKPYGGVLTQDSFDGALRWQKTTNMAAARIALSDYQPFSGGACLEISNDSETSVDGTYVEGSLQFSLLEEDYVYGRMMYRLLGAEAAKAVEFRFHYANFDYTYRFGIRIDVQNDRLYYLDEAEDWILIEDVDARQGDEYWIKVGIIGDLRARKYLQLEILGRIFDLSDKLVYRAANVGTVKGFAYVQLEQEGAVGRAQMFIDDLVITGE